MWDVGNLSRNPAVYWFGFVDAGYQLSVRRMVIERGLTITHPDVKSKRTGAESAAAFGPIVGRKSRSTGAVWSMSCTGSASQFPHSMYKCSDTYRLKRLLSIHKVQCPKYQPRLGLPVTLRPRFAQQIPFGLELLTQPTPES